MTKDLTSERLAKTMLKFKWLSLVFLLFAGICFSQEAFVDAVDGRPAARLLLWGGVNGTDSDTTFNVSYSNNDTSQAFYVYRDMSIQINLKTADADSLGRIKFYMLYADRDIYTAFKDSACGVAYVVRDSITSISITPPISIGLTCPALWGKLVADGLNTAGHMNGGTTESTGSAWILRFKPK